MGEIIGAGIALAILAAIATGMIVSEKKRNSLFPDDGFIWPEHLEELRKKVQFDFYIPKRGNTKRSNTTTRPGPNPGIPKTRPCADMIVRHAAQRTLNKEVSMGHGKIKIGSMAFSASQIGTLYGCGWNTMLELYNKYKGINAVLQEPSEEAKESMEFGSFFEEPVAQFFAKKMGFKIKRCGETAYWKNDMPYFICHPDRLVIGRDEQGRRVGIEVKCVSPYSEGWGESGTTEIPDVYYFQVQGYFVCGVPCDVVYVVCMRGNRIYVYEILPDEEVIADIRYRVAKAKADFDADIIPEPVNYNEALNLYRQKVNMEADGIGANDEVMEKYNRLLQIQRRNGAPQRDAYPAGD